MIIIIDLVPTLVPVKQHELNTNFDSIQFQINNIK